MTTIQKCFRKAGFSDMILSKPDHTDKNENNDDDDNRDYDNDDDIPLRVIQMSREIFGCEFQELVYIDEKLKHAVKK